MDSSQEEIHFINVTLRRLDLEMQHLHHLRSKFHRRLNELNALTSSFPPELLSRIFEIALEKRNKYAPQNLAAVCSRWRDIIDSTPTLWQTLAIRLRVKNEVPLNSLSLVQHYVQRVGVLPMKLKLIYNRDLSGTYNKVLRVSSLTFFEQCFQACSGSLGNLVLENIPQAWWFPLSLITSRSTTYPSLKYISLSWSAIPEETVGLFRHDNAPRLTNVSLSGRRFPVDLPWGQLVTLNLDNLVISQCLNLLIACPLLREFNCKSPTPTFNETAELIAREISRVGIFTQMKRMSWDFGLNDWDTVLMDNARFPSLKWMAWRRHASGVLITRAFQGSPFNPVSRNEFVSSLQALTVFGASLHLWTIEDLCAVLPNTLQELYLKGDGLESRLPHCLDVLTLHKIDDSSSGHFPCLRVLGLPDLYACSKPTILMNSLLSMLRSRRPSTMGIYGTQTGGDVVSLERLYFSLPRTKIEWDRDQVNSLQDLIRQGLVIETSEERTSFIH